MADDDLTLIVAPDGTGVSLPYSERCPCPSVLAMLLDPIGACVRFLDPRAGQQQRTVTARTAQADASSLTLEIGPVVVRGVDLWKSPLDAFLDGVNETRAREAILGPLDQRPPRFALAGIGVDTASPVGWVVHFREGRAPYPEFELPLGPKVGMMWLTWATLNLTRVLGRPGFQRAEAIVGAGHDTGLMTGMDDLLAELQAALPLTDRDAMALIVMHSWSGADHVDDMRRLIAKGGP